MAYRASVVIPAHDEEALVARLLARLIAGDPQRSLELIVVANGCRDRTAAVARAHGPRVTVIELDRPSKIAALNAADAAATAFPRVYLDADVHIDARTVFALADALADGDTARVAAPRFEVDVSRSSWPVRQYYGVWRHSRYRTQSHVGDGVYALSRAGRQRFDEFPPIIADDLFVQRMFAPAERVVLHDHRFTVAAPKTLRAHLRRARRVFAGNDELRALASSGALHLADHDEPATARTGSLARAVLHRPQLWAGAVVYVAAYAASRLGAARARAQGRPIAWNSIRAGHTRPAG